MKRAIVLILAILLASIPTLMIQAGYPSLRYGLGMGITIPDLISSFKGLAELSLPFLTLRTSLDVSSLFGVLILSIDETAIVQFGRRLRPYLGVGVGLSVVKSAFGTTANPTANGVAGFEMRLGGSTLFAQLKVRTFAERGLTYNFDLGMIF